MNLEEVVKRELRDVKYYYSRKEFFDECFKQTGNTEVFSIVQKYNKYICGAKAKLYDLYCCIYLQYKTQEAVAIELGVTHEYVRKTHKALLEYFCECIENERR